MIVRPVKVSDLPALMTLVQQAGPGFTTLPANEDRLAHRVRWAQRAFSGQVERADADYLFVLEDDDLRVVGVSALTGNDEVVARAGEAFVIVGAAVDEVDVVST